MKLVLASASPRRKELLSLLNIPFEVRVADIHEGLKGKESPVDFVERLSFEKASKVLSGQDECVIGADTVVVLGDIILGKPIDSADAEKMLSELSGKWHYVYTGVCLICGTRKENFSIKTEVLFDSLTDKEIKEYIQSKEPMDKAGAYAIQGIGGKFIKELRGSYSNVVGLPLNELKNVLNDIYHSK